MGRAKAGQQEHQDKVQQAIALCIEVGAIEECELHPASYTDTLSFLDMDELTKEILDSNPEAIEFFADKDEMTECIRDAMESAGEECGFCAKNRDS